MDNSITQLFIEYGTYGLIVLALAGIATIIISLTFLSYLKKCFNNKNK